MSRQDARVEPAPRKRESADVTSRMHPFIAAQAHTVDEAINECLEGSSAEYVNGCGEHQGAVGA